MRTFKFFNPQNTVVVDVETDAISLNNDNLTIHDINFIRGNRNDLVSMGFNLDILPTNRVALKTLATAMNLSLDEIDPMRAAKVELVTATELEITTETADLDAGVQGVAMVSTLTCPAFAAAGQGDFFVVYNKAGESFAVWLDKDNNGTAPSGTIFTAATYKVEVNIVTGDTAAQVAAKIKVAVELNANWNFATITDNLNGTLSLLQSELGDIADMIRKNAAESGNGSFTVVTATPGSGDYSDSLAATGGNGTLVFTEVGDNLPVGFTLHGDGTITGVTAETGDFVFTAQVTDHFGQTATKELTLTVS